MPFSSRFSSLCDAAVFRESGRNRKSRRGSVPDQSPRRRFSATPGGPTVERGTTTEPETVQHRRLLIPGQHLGRARPQQAGNERLRQNLRPGPMLWIPRSVAPCRSRSTSPCCRFERVCLPIRRAWIRLVEPAGNANAREVVEPCSSSRPLAEGRRVEVDPPGGQTKLFEDAARPAHEARSRRRGAALRDPDERADRPRRERSRSTVGPALTVLHQKSPVVRDGQLGGPPAQRNGSPLRSWPRRIARRFPPARASRGHQLPGPGCRSTGCALRARGVLARPRKSSHGFLLKEFTL